MNNNNQELLKLIESYDTIAVFRHVNPDGDALGSQCGFAKWVKHNYPEKTVYLLGSNEHNYKIYPMMDDVSDLGVFLAVVIDTANRPRIDDERYLLGDKLVKIDHHPEVDPYGDVQIVDTKRGSACEIVTDVLRSFDKEFTEDIANTLLSGILTDTIRFSVEAVSSKTLQSAAYLMDQGANITKLNQDLFTMPRAVFELKNKIVQNVQVKNAFSYIVMDKTQLEAINSTSREVKGFVNVMSGIEEFAIWAIFTQEEDGLFEGSVRSRNNTINDIVAEFGGGGHRLASGVSGLTLEQRDALIAALAKRSTE
ncbi:bifunctional oligoribonuclease/PAP phosphatase NrnA [Erysipelothrix sp. HDW6C]|uniref:DHH family phosphoesterase n=1 Tax=Erysipelothrix sp. HDW6C TaxID=2714930 RepID=UPI00140DC78A|nr:bifunctional oligoribonuclease/PAP phosphatase NrnA [Erysipelothrix sp. HDW6C]QIK70114.1 bifunctional oligoribonuclease/PAP phosphatase NrnA [Erysipelothrix sp. HDW6C]